MSYNERAGQISQMAQLIPGVTKCSSGVRNCISDMLDDCFSFHFTDKHFHKRGIIERALDKELQDNRIISKIPYLFVMSQVILLIE